MNRIGSLYGHKKTTNIRPPLATLACVTHRCELYEQKGQDNLTVRKTWRQDGIRYLRCQSICIVCSGKEKDPDGEYIGYVAPGATTP